MRLKQGTIKRLHVNKHTIARNVRHKLNAPAILIQTSKGSIQCRKAVIKGESTLLHGEKPLSCGARIWIETKAEIEYE